jgi:hypothetical protein
VLCLTGIAAACLAILGWSQRGNGLVAAEITAPPAASASVSPSGPPSALSSRPYASYAYLVWPGPLDADGQLAMTGFTIDVTRQAGGISVKATQDGEAMTSVSHFYPGGAKVYVLDSNLGDDGGGNVDYDESDDGLVVTNAQGQVLP